MDKEILASGVVLVVGLAATIYGFFLPSDGFFSSLSVMGLVLSLTAAVMYRIHCFEVHADKFESLVMACFEKKDDKGEKQ
jgi:hypothetical protein